mmetsp:Transcript_20293/g.44324  ORF Transcript_20293/g.44324 Transcript_20293/m.44324 type:complete len:431 (-) Transcript_20293:678-1970(-)
MMGASKVLSCTQNSCSDTTITTMMIITPAIITAHGWTGLCCATSNITKPYVHHLFIRSGQAGSRPSPNPYASCSACCCCCCMADLEDRGLCRPTARQRLSASCPARATAAAASLCLCAASACALASCLLASSFRTASSLRCSTREARRRRSVTLPAWDSSAAASCRSMLTMAWFRASCRRACSWRTARSRRWLNKAARLRRSATAEAAAAVAAASFSSVHCRATARDRAWRASSCCTARARRCRKRAARSRLSSSLAAWAAAAALICCSLVCRAWAADCCCCSRSLATACSRRCRKRAARFRRSLSFSACASAAACICCSNSCFTSVRLLATLLTARSRRSRKRAARSLRPCTCAACAAAAAASWPSCACLATASRWACRSSSFLTAASLRLRNRRARFRRSSSLAVWAAMAAESFWSFISLALALDSSW